MIRNGINQDAYDEFELFNIADLQTDLCKYCRKGEFCPVHNKKFERKVLN